MASVDIEKLNSSLSKIKDSSFKKNINVIIDGCREKNQLISILYASILLIPFCFFAYMALYVIFIRDLPTLSEYTDIHDLFKDTVAIIISFGFSIASFWGLLSVKRNYRSAYFYQDELWDEKKITSVLNNLDASWRNILVQKFQSMERISNSSISKIIYAMCEEKIKTEAIDDLEKQKQLIKNL